MSMRGKSMDPFFTVTGLSVPHHDHEARPPSSGLPVRPSCSQIRADVSGIKGAASTAESLSDSQSVLSTASSLSISPSFPSFHGCVSSMYLFERLINVQRAFRASSKAKRSINVSISLTVLFARSSISLSISSLLKLWGSSPPRNFSIIWRLLLRRFPRSFARSEFILCTMAFSEKSPSLPKGTSRSTK